MASQATILQRIARQNNIDLGTVDIRSLLQISKPGRKVSRGTQAAFRDVNPELAELARFVSGAFDLQSQVSKLKDTIEKPGTNPADIQFARDKIAALTPQIQRFAQGVDNQGFDRESFAPIFQQFTDVGIEFTDDPGGGITVQPIGDLIQAPVEREVELPPEPPPLRDVIGQQPGQQPGGQVAPPRLPTDPGGLPVPGQPVLPQVTPDQPGQVSTQPVQGTRQSPVQTTIAINDPRNPGQLIEIPVVDRGIPGDIDRQADQFLLEREGLRQQEQNRQAFEAQRGIRSQRLGETRSLLEDIAGTQFEQNQAGLLERLQTGGLLQTSELESAFAREAGRLTTGVQQAFSAQSLQDREAEIQGIGDILGKRQAFQTAGLQREFSLEDFNRAAQVARETGASVTPQVGGGGGIGGILGGGLAGAASGAALGTAIPGLGTGVGAGIGTAIGLIGGGAGGGK